jgi:hypothetical protein
LSSRCLFYKNKSYLYIGTSLIYCTKWVGWVMIFNATFNNISVLSWLSVLLVEETGEHGENQRPAANHSQTLSSLNPHLLLKCLYQTRSTWRKPPTCTDTDKLYQCRIEYTSPWARIELTTSVEIDTDCICRCQCNYHTITTPHQIDVKWHECIWNGPLQNLKWKKKGHQDKICIKIGWNFTLTFQP